MPVFIDICAELGVFVTRYSGVVDAHEFVDAYLSIRNDGSAFAAFDELADMSRLEDFNVPPVVLRDEAERAAGVLRRIGRTVRCAVIAPEDKSFGLSRIYSAQAGYLGQEDVTVCRNKTEAIDWIGLPAECEAKLLGCGSLRV